MKKILTLTIALIAFITAKAQDVNRHHGDSLVLQTWQALKAKDYTKAATIATQAITFMGDSFGKESMEVESALLPMVYIDIEQKDYDNALTCALQALRIVEKHKGSESTDVAEILQTVASVYSWRKDYDSAAVQLQRAMDIVEKAKGKECPLYKIELDSYFRAKDMGAFQPALNGNYEEAIRRIRTVLDEKEKVFGKYSNDYLFTLSTISSVYTFMLDAIYKTKKTYEEYENDSATIAVERLQKALQEEELPIIGQVYGTESDYYVNALSNLGSQCAIIRDFSEAENYCRKAIAIIENTKGKDSPEYADQCFSLATITSLGGRQREARPIALMALRAKEQFLSKDSADYVKQLRDIADNYERFGLPSEAMHVTESIINFLSQQGDKGEEYAKALTKMADFKKESDDFTACLTLLDEALAIRRQNKDINYGQALYSRAGLDEQLGQYFDALDRYHLAGEVFDSIGSPTAIRWKGLVLTAMAGVYDQLGNNQKSAKMMKEQMLYQQKYEGRVISDLEWRDIDNDINGGRDLIFTDKEAQESVLRSSHEMMTIMEDRGEEHSADYASCLISLTPVYIARGEYSTALDTIALALKLHEEVGGKSLDYALDKQLEAYCLNKLGKMRECKETIAEALSIRRRLLPKEHPDILSTLCGLANQEAEMGIDSAAVLAQEATYALRDKVRSTFAQLTASERDKYWEQWRDWFQNGLPRVAITFPNSTMTQTAYDGVLLSKGLLLDTEMSMSRLIARSGDSDLLNEFYKLRIMQTKLDNTANGALADSLAEIMETSERKLLQGSKAYGDYTRNLTVTWQNVRENLADSCAAIEFITAPGDTKRGRTYVALILRKHDTGPSWITLFSDSDLKSITPQDYYTTPRLSDMVWKPLEQYLRNVRDVYFSPDGMLYNIAVEYLPSFDGNGLLSDRWHFHRLSSTREIATANGGHEGIRQSVVFGGIDYDHSARGDVPAAYHDWNDNALSPQDINGLRGAAGMGGAVSALPATKTEAEGVDKLLKDMHVEDSLFTGAHATERVFRNLSGKGKQLLHIATHGFYWTAREADDLNYSFLGSGDDKALTRSGLLLAGANNTLSGETDDNDDDGNDGILTAKEIAAIDLGGMDMVVLSACQTGLGELTGDGVSGLQRGFKKAGVRTLMMSLWKVDDEATRMLMIKFYDSLAEGMDKQSALIAAQRHLREYRRNGTQPFNNPKYWAAFILLDADL